MTIIFDFKIIINHKSLLTSAYCSKPRKIHKSFRVELTRRLLLLNNFHGYYLILYSQFIIADVRSVRRASGQIVASACFVTTWSSLEDWGEPSRRASCDSAYRYIYGFIIVVKFL